MINKEIKNTQNYNIIKERIEYCFNINHNIKRKNEILNEDYNIQNTNEMLLSIKNIKNTEISQDCADNQSKKINIKDHDLFEYNYNNKYLVTFEIIYLNKKNKNYIIFLKQILENNNIKSSNLKEINININKEKILKEKGVFYFDEFLKKNHKNT